MKLKNKIIKTAVMVVAVCGITFAFQTIIYAKRRILKLPIKSRKNSQKKKSFKNNNNKIYKTLSWIKCIFRQDGKSRWGNPYNKEETYYIKCHLCAINTATVVFENGVMFKK